jgi:hypothetical protein
MSSLRAKLGMLSTASVRGHFSRGMRWLRSSALFLYLLGLGVGKFLESSLRGMGVVLKLKHRFGCMARRVPFGIGRVLLIRAATRRFTYEILGIVLKAAAWYIMLIRLHQAGRLLRVEA